MPSMDLMGVPDHESHQAEAVYVGFCGPESEHGHGGPRIVGVRQGDILRNLTPRAGAPTDEPPFEWGYFGRGPCNLARAILFDRLGVEVSEDVALAFTDEVIRNLPSEEFELPSDRVDAWVATHDEKPRRSRRLNDVATGASW